MKKRIFFMHVGKCGGNSIIAALKSQYWLPDNAEQQFIHLNALGSREAAAFLERDKWDYRNDLLSYFMHSPNNYCIVGHFRFNNQLYQIFSQEFAFVTILREPVSHFLSTYFYNRYKPFKDPSNRINEDLEKFVDTAQAYAIGYRYIKFLMGRCNAKDFTSPQALNIAMQNLEKFDLVGVLESLPLFQEQFQERFGKSLDIQHQKKSPRPEHIKLSDIRSEVIEKITEICQPNQQLYEFAVNRLIHRF